MDRIVGKTPPPPPAGVPGIEPDIRGATSIRVQLAKHRDDATCAACHAKIDPPGFALECFDVIGGYRERYRANRETASETTRVAQPLYIDTNRIQRDPQSRSHPQTVVGLGQSVDPSGDYQGQAFRDISEFRQLLLADEEQLARAFVTKLVTYSTGSGLQFADRDEVEKIVKRLSTHQFGVRAAIHEVVQCSMFLNR